MTLARRVILALAAALAIPGPLPAAAQGIITLATTTSAEHSGLFGHLLPLFTAATGIEVRVIAQGSGQALESARRGDVDLVLAHARAEEARFVAEGWGVQRHEVMVSDFVLVGPGDDPAGVRRAASAAEAMARIAAAESPFVSRGDDSGTHVAEQALWAAARIAPGGRWYLSTGSGMGATLNTAAQIPAHALSDRGTWAAFRNRGPLEILFQGDPMLANPYGLILVNPERHPHVRAEAGQAFVDWMLSEAGQAAIAGFALNGVHPFAPAAP